MADETESRSWFDWLPWRGDEAEPEVEPQSERGGWLDRLLGRDGEPDPTPEPVAEAMTVLGMDPLLALILLIAILGCGIALYSKPRAFMRGFAEVMGGAVGAVLGTILGGALLVGAAVVYFDAAGMSILVILAIVGAIALFGFFASGGG